MTARGIRNNNPFNVEGASPWLGKTGMDGPYVVFADAYSGMRAGFRDIYTKWSHGLTTTTAIITKFAPPFENNTAAYITAVCAELGVKPDDQLDFNNPAQFMKFGRAIMRHEVGAVPYPLEIIAKAMQAAYPAGAKAPRRVS
jgi:hypothetical protein